MRAVEVEWEVGALHDRLLGDERQVVAVERDVERPDRDLGAFVLQDRRGDPAGERHAAALDADRTRPSVPACFSTISWEIRVVARRMSSAAMIRRPVVTGRSGVARSRSPSRPHGAIRPHGTGSEIGIQSSAEAASVDRDGDLAVPDHDGQPQIRKKSGRYRSTTRSGACGP